MKLSYNWLREVLPQTPAVGELTDLLTAAGIKVEKVEFVGCGLEKVVVARIVESVRHPNADRLSVCQVDDGTGRLRQIVCGAKNYKVGDKVPLALPGAELPGGVKIRSGKLRGEVSDGMLCSGKELGLDEDAQGLLILETDEPPGTELGRVFPPDTLFELEVTPNRGDWLSVYGVAREVAAFLGVAQPQPLVSVRAVRRAEAGRARIADRAGCLLYSLRRISGVRVGPSPAWLRSKLRAAGLRPINNVVDITNFVLLEMGQPLHAFDAGLLAGGGLEVRRAREGEVFLALDGRELKLCAEDLVIADGRGAVALAGVIGGAGSAVSEKTTEVWLESALFDPVCIRRSARRHDVSTDSSYRFERGVDAEGVLAASERAVALLAELAGGQAEECVWVDGEVPPRKGPVELRHERCRQLLGCAVGDEEICGALERLGLAGERRGEGLTAWRPPSWRRDLEREVDLIEEVARIIGIGKVAARNTAVAAPKTWADRLYDACGSLRERLCAWGFFEARSSALVSPRLLEKFGFDVRGALRLRNPLGEETSLLRPSLVPGLLAALETNLRHGRRDVKFFEIGAVYGAGEKGERQTLGLLACGHWGARDWRLPGPVFAGFGLVRGVVEGLVGGVEVRADEAPGCVVGARVLAKGVEAGWLGIVKASLARELGLGNEVEVIVGEVWLEEFLRGAERGVGFRPLPRFPSMERDVAMLVDEGLEFSALEAVMRGVTEPLLVGWRLFDEFRDAEGVKAPRGKKSWAISLTFAAADRTLEGAEVDAAAERVRGLLRSRLGAEIRM